MADETEATEELRPQLSRWDFFAREDQLRAEDDKLRTLRMANVGRKLLAGTASDLNDRLPKGVVEIAGMEADLARKLAVTSIGMVATRACSAAILLIRSGYESEALMPTRSVVEAEARIHQIAADKSGEAARQVLTGTASRSTLNKAARKHGQAEMIAVLDKFSHTNPVTLEASVIDGTPDVLGSGILEIRPVRGALRPMTQLYSLAYSSVRISVQICEVFEVGLVLPRFLSDELAHYRDNPIPHPL